MTREIIIRRLVEVCNQDTQECIGEDSEHQENIDLNQEDAEDQLLAAPNSTLEENSITFITHSYW